jgi:hypothetical protein
MKSSTHPSGGRLMELDKTVAVSEVWSNDINLLIQNIRKLLVAADVPEERMQKHLDLIIQKPDIAGAVDAGISVLRDEGYTLK